VESVFADLVDVRAVAVHSIEVCHYVLGTHAELRLARGGKDECIVRQIQWVNVADALSECKLFEPGTVGVDLVDVIIVVDVFAHREDDFLTTEVNFRIADDTFGKLDKCLDLAARCQVDGL
jgi:hypothetical protein